MSNLFLKLKKEFLAKAKKSLGKYLANLCWINRRYGSEIKHSVLEVPP